MAAMAAVTAAVPAVCPRCGAQNYKGSLFCDACRVYLRDPTMTVERATYTRRFFGDSVLEGLLVVVTLIIGWFIWFIFTSKTGQSPAKRLVNTYAINVETGRNIGRGDAWLREVVVKFLAVGIANGITSGLAGLIDDIWLFFDKDRQTLHDKVLKQVIVYAPNGLPEDMQHMELAPPRYIAPGIVPGQTAPPPAQPHVQDTAGELRELQRLKDEGLITDEEYERKRAALVEKM
jgi:uncharacterized RDD family membrane protein YckC